MREVFFCAEEDNSQYIGLWLEAPLFELRFVESGRRLSRPQLSPFHHSLLHFSAANNIRQTPAPSQHHRRRGSKVFHFDFSLLWTVLLYLLVRARRCLGTGAQADSWWFPGSMLQLTHVASSSQAAGEPASLQRAAPQPHRRYYLWTSQQHPCLFNAFAPIMHARLHPSQVISPKIGEHSNLCDLRVSLKVSHKYLKC